MVFLILIYISPTRTVRTHFRVFYLSTLINILRMVMYESGPLCAWLVLDRSTLQPFQRAQDILQLIAGRRRHKRPAVVEHDRPNSHRLAGEGNTQSACDRSSSQGRACSQPIPFLIRRVESTASGEKNSCWHALLAECTMAR
jgi:hypothetical protein